MPANLAARLEKDIAKKASLLDVDNNQDSFRLPDAVVPRAYRIRIAPDLDSMRFEGSVEIEVEVRRPVNEVVLHALELTPKRALVDSENRSFVIDKELERLVIECPSGLAEGTHTLSVDYSGPINERLRGLYRSVYTDEDGQDHYVLATHFEPTDARRAFPCFDEPDKKARFSLELEVPEAFTAVSNWPVASIAPNGAGKKLVKFEPTIPMSTYLVAVVVGELEATEPLYFGSVPIRVVHAPGKGSLTPFALEVAKHSLEFFTDYFGIPYPAPKLDLIALPDFAFGAMENLGAVTFRETALLVDRENAARTDLERVADVVAHELAHMWFGDLVTMKWWNGIWLNEAFATFMEMLAVDAFRPQWERWVTFGLSREGAMAIDGLPSTRPVEYPVRLPAEAEGMFDALTYQKGAAVLRMLEQFLGPEVFRDGIRSYLERFAYKNTETSDLWHALEEATDRAGRHVPVAELMDSFIFQGGYPVVAAERAGPGAIRITQRPFNYMGPERAGAIGSEWIVPVTIRDLETGASEHMLLRAEGGEAAGHSGGVVLNADGWGYFRCRYGQGLAEAVRAAYPRLSKVERFNLLTDSYALALSGEAPFEEFVSLARTCAAMPDTDANILSAVHGPVAFLDRLVAEGNDTVASFAKVVFSPPLEALGLDARPGEPENNRTARALLYDALGLIAKDETVVQRCRDLFELYRKGAQIDPDLEQEVLYVVAEQGGAEAFEAIYSRYRKAETPQQELRAMYGMARFSEPDLVERVLEMTLDEFRTQNAAFVLAVMLANKRTQDRAWAHVKANWDTILDRYPPNTVVRMLETVRTFVKPGGDDSLARDAKEFLASHRVPSGERTVMQSLERLEVNVAFARRIGPRLRDYLRQGQ
jgi:puromycin-sensitive aminopeptidase